MEINYQYSSHYSHNRRNRLGWGLVGWGLKEVLDGRLGLISISIQTRRNISIISKPYNTLFLPAVQPEKYKFGKQGHAVK
jgi:hypothetical protein